MATAVSNFDLQTYSFPGSKSDQARFLLRKVRALGNVDPNLAVLPETLKAMLEDRLPKPQQLKTLLRSLFAVAGIEEKRHLGGNLDSPVSSVNGKSALYFVIHDTSSPTLPYDASFPVNIDDAAWSGNKFGQYLDVSDPVAHVFVNRAGVSRTGHDFSTPYRATKFENDDHFGPAVRGRFVHVELMQPRRRNSRGIDEFAPRPGFTPKQLERLALLYVCASVRARDWLVPVFHCVLDEGIRNGHDDPQNFSLADWGSALSGLMSSLGQGTTSLELASEHGGTLLTPHQAFLDLAQIYSMADVEFPGLKPVTLAHWALASNWGHSGLAIELNNFAHLPYREEMAELATSEFLKTESGAGRQWCEFDSQRRFISGYWRWLDREPFDGWRAHAGNPRDFMEFVGEIYAGVSTYPPRVLALVAQTASLLEHTGAKSIPVHPHGDMSASVPVTGLTTATGYKPPTASLEVLKGIPLDQAQSIAANYVARFSRWDATKIGRRDPSLCKGIFQLPSGAILWDSKMAVDADGSPHESVLKTSGGSSRKTSYMFKSRAGKQSAPVNPEIVPYLVLPARDTPERDPIPAGPWEGSNDHFATDFGISLGALGVVIFGNKMTGAIFADEGPAAKLGEASIRVHELIRKYPAPWNGDPADLKIKDASEDKGVIFVVFPGTRFDIDAYGPERQVEMAAAIQAAARAEFDKLRTLALPALYAALRGPAPSIALRTLQVSAPAADIAPVELFASASSWEGLLRDLDGEPNDPAALDDTVPQGRFAIRAVDKLLADFPGRRMMIGFDERIYDAGQLDDDEASRYAAARDKVKMRSALISVYHGGAYGATGDAVSNVPDPDVDLRNWDPDEAERLMNAARDAGIAVGNRMMLDPERGSDRALFAKVLDAWDSGKWWARSLAKLTKYKSKGFAAAEIDNLGRPLRRYPKSFESHGMHGYLGFLRVYADAFVAGAAPPLIMKNVSVADLGEIAERVQAADAPGKLPRAMFADFHICEIAANLKLAPRQVIADASARIGIQTVFSVDTYHYRAHGLFGDAARAGLRDIYKYIAAPKVISKGVRKGGLPLTTKPGNGRYNGGTLAKDKPAAARRVAPAAVTARAIHKAAKPGKRRGSQDHGE